MEKFDQPLHRFHQDLAGVDEEEINSQDAIQEDFVLDVFLFFPIWIT